MILFAFIAEYYLLRARDEYHNNQLKTYSRGNRVNFKQVQPARTHKYLERASHITVIIGTVIWRYGDLIFYKLELKYSLKDNYALHSDSIAKQRISI
ncbi:MAG: hypothetical protein D8M61_17800 [Ignavibacteriae bacterium]|nr:hypothetical protein [Ignavibacteriota bacterium]